MGADRGRPPVRRHTEPVEVAGLPVLHAHDDFVSDDGFFRCRLCEPDLPPAQGLPRAAAWSAYRRAVRG